MISMARFQYRTAAWRSSSSGPDHRYSGSSEATFTPAAASALLNAGPPRRRPAGAGRTAEVVAGRQFDVLVAEVATTPGSSSSGRGCAACTGPGRSSPPPPRCRRTVPACRCQRHQHPLARAQRRTHARVRHHRRRVAVPGVRAHRVPAPAVRELIQSPGTPRRTRPGSVPASPPAPGWTVAGRSDHHRAQFAECRRTVLAHDLAADVVAVPDVDRDLHVHEGAAGPARGSAAAGPAAAAPAVARLRGISTRVAVISSPNIQRTMSISCTARRDRSWRSTVERRHARVAVRAVQHQRGRRSRRCRPPASAPGTPASYRRM